jgi:hypothetical protein
MDNRLQLHGILSAKFIALILHTLQMCVSVYAVENNIFSGLPMNYILDSNTAIAERDKITPMLIVMLAIGIIMNGIEFLFSLVNFTMLNHRLNIVSTPPFTQTSSSTPSDSSSSSGTPSTSGTTRPSGRSTSSSSSLSSHLQHPPLHRRDGLELHRHPHIFQN